MINSSCATCSSICLGREGHHGECCSVGSNSWILNLCRDDIPEFLKKLSGKFDRDVKYEDVFIEYEEGSKLLPNDRLWQDPACYPALRVDMESERKFCIFYNKAIKACNVYDIRPRMCQNYTCDYLKKLTKK